MEMDIEIKEEEGEELTEEKERQSAEKRDRMMFILQTK